MTLYQFVKTGQRNAWVTGDRLKCYVRVSQRLLESSHTRFTSCLDIANVTVGGPAEHSDYRGKGRFTDFLAKAERLANKHGLAVYIENAMEPRFRAFFIRRGYQKAKDVNCFYLPMSLL